MWNATEGDFVKRCEGPALRFQNTKICAVASMQCSNIYAVERRSILKKRGSSTMDYKDYYATLGISKTASADEIQKAYRKLARKYHPDVNNDDGAEDRFKEITEAYEVLKDPEKRSTYDRFGSSWKQAGGRGGAPPGFEGMRFDFGGGDSGYSSFFESLFGGGSSGFSGFPGGGGHGGQGFRTKGRNKKVRVALTLEEAAEGGERDFTISDPTTGRARTLTVNVPAGVKSGQKIRLQGQGGAGTGGGPRGDLLIQVEFKPHDHFRLEERDLYFELPVAPWEAALGGEATIRTLDGTLRVKIPAGSSSGRRIRLRGKGFPNPKGPAGDLFAEIRLTVPTELTQKERELFEQLAETSSYKAR